jgi:hypothetical protein
VSKPAIALATAGNPPPQGGRGRTEFADALSIHFG